MSSRIRPRWIVFSVLVMFITVSCMVLGFWQLGRLQERRASNAVLDSRLAREPVPLVDIRNALGPVEGIEADPSDYEHTRVTARGVLVDEGRVLVRSQVVNGQAGTHAVFPLDLEDGTAVLVNVGWFPLGIDPGPAAGLFPPSGRIELTGLVRASRLRPAFGRQEAEGHLETVARIDVGRIQEQVGLPLLPFWIQFIGPDDPQRLPVPAPVPAVEEGTHLSYAVQWFSFGSIALVGYVALMRKELGPTRRRHRKAG